MDDIKGSALEPTDYHSYLLRLWRDEDRKGPDQVGRRRAWRVSLENPITGERTGFADLEGLFDYLREQTADWQDGEAHSAHITAEENRSAAI
jgi:hypothetical protein